MTTKKRPENQAPQRRALTLLADSGMNSCRMAFVQGGVLVNGGTYRRFRLIECLP